jgi:hypothetical protein
VTEKSDGLALGKSIVTVGNERPRAGTRVDWDSPLSCSAKDPASSLSSKWGLACSNEHAERGNLFQPVAAFESSGTAVRSLKSRKGIDLKV